jgi:hypothetical protein
MTKILDASDLDQYMGKPIQPARMKEAIHNNDIRRWAQGMHYANRLHYAADYAAESRFTRLVAPQSPRPKLEHLLQLSASACCCSNARC